MTRVSRLIVASPVRIVPTLLLRVRCSNRKKLAKDFSKLIATETRPGQAHW